MRKKTYLRLKRITLVTVSVLGVCAVIYVYFFTPLFQIQTIAIHTKHGEQIPDIQESLMETLRKPLLYYIPGDRILTYHEPRLEALVLERIPYAEDISITLAGLHTLDITIALKVPLFRIPDNKALAAQGEPYLDSRDLSSLPLLRASSTIPEATRTSLALFVENIEEVLWEVPTIDINDHGDVYISGTGVSGHIILPPTASYDTLWSTLLSAIDTDPLKSKLATTPQSFDYIDLRFGNKVFYKFTNKQEAAIIPEQSTDYDMATTTIQ